MSQFFINKGFNRNLYVQLSGGERFYQIDVYVVARFRFFYVEGVNNWTRSEIAAWTLRFARLVYNTWSEQWELFSDISCDPINVERGRIFSPRARVRVHVVDVENSSVRLATNQHIFAINVFRRAARDYRQRQWAGALDTSRATVADARNIALPSGATEAQIYEDSLEIRNSEVDANVQRAAMHEFGHMLGLMHPNDMQEGCMRDRSASICYGQAYSPESESIMGRGQEVRRDEYRVFVHIISQLVPTVLSRGSLSLFDRTHRLLWSVEGTNSVWCDGRLSSIENLDIGIRGTRRGAIQRGPVGLV